MLVRRQADLHLAFLKTPCGGVRFSPDSPFPEALLGSYNHPYVNLIRTNEPHCRVAALPLAPVGTLRAVAPTHHQRRQFRRPWARIPRVSPHCYLCRRRRCRHKPSALPALVIVHFRIPAQIAAAASTHLPDHDARRSVSCGCSQCTRMYRWRSKGVCVFTAHSRPSSSTKWTSYWKSGPSS